MMRRLRLWHVLTLGIFGLFGVLGAWLVLAYGELPHLWSNHEHERIGAQDEIVAYTSQGIPADPINLRLTGTEASVSCAFRRAGWSLADRLSVRSAVGIVWTVVSQQPYPGAPVSSLYFQERLQDFAFEKDEGRTARNRHHVRLWQVGPNDWVGAATFDRGVELAPFTLQVTHHIGPDVDAERDSIGRTLESGGARFVEKQSSRIAPGRWHRNGGGDKYMTDGQINDYVLNATPC